MIKKPLQNLVYEEKRIKICLIPARSCLVWVGGKAGNAFNGITIDKFFNDKQANFNLLNLCSRFCMGLIYLIRIYIDAKATEVVNFNTKDFMSRIRIIKLDQI
ncbi:MAG: hypothetical protein ACE5D0_04865 [Fidelibacterota bacterium]